MNKIFIIIFDRKWYVFWKIKIVDLYKLYFENVFYLYFLYEIEFDLYVLIFFLKYN